MTTISKNTVCVVVNNLGIRFVVTSSQMLLSKSKTNSIGNTLTKRTSGDFNSRSFKVLRMARSFASPLTELLQVFLFNSIISSKMKKSILKHTPMSSRENKSISVKPIRVLRVIPHDLIIQYMTHGRTTHG